MEISEKQRASNATRPSVSGHKARRAVLMKLLSDGELMLRNDGLCRCQSKLREKQKEKIIFCHREKCAIS